MKRFLTVVCAICMVFAFACVSFAAPEGKIKTEKPPKKELPKVDRSKALDQTKEEKKDPKDANKGRKVEKKEEPKKGDKP